MTQLVCPFCGPRELEEFSFRKTLPEAGSAGFTELYERVNRLDLSVEHWQHVQGCRAWLVVRRNPSTGAFLEVQLSGRAS
jgi:sarcosine oxidase subunit delta